MTTQREPQIGDKIKLTGRQWNASDYGTDLRGQVVTIDEVRHGSAYFSYKTDSDDTNSTFLYRNGRSPDHFEAWHFADEPRVGDLVKLTGDMYSTEVKEAGPYRVHESTLEGRYDDEVEITTADDVRYTINYRDDKESWGAETLPDRPAEAAPKLKLEVGSWIKFKPGSGVDEYHPQVYSVASLDGRGVGVNIPASELTGAVNDRVCYWGSNSMDVVPAPEIAIGPLDAENIGNAVLTAKRLNDGLAPSGEDQTVTFDGFSREEIDAEVAEEQAYDMVDPLHYKGFSNGAEPIDILEHLTPNCAAAGKYIIRVGRKPGNDAVQELEKAIRYIRREINLLEGNPSW